MYRTKFIRDHDPLISIIIPNKDHTDDLKTVYGFPLTGNPPIRTTNISLWRKTVRRKKTFRFYKELEENNPKARVVYWDREFNYSAINNYGASLREGRISASSE